MASPSPKSLTSISHPLSPPIYLQKISFSSIQNPTFSIRIFPSSHFSIFLSSSMASNTQSYFEDLLPIMAEKLGGDGLIGELCNGFRLLMDGDKGAITFDSLKRNAALLGLQDLTDDDLKSMVKEGDFDGDGALNQMEFCVLMFRLSPELMDQSRILLEEALQRELNDFY